MAAFDSGVGGWLSFVEPRGIKNGWKVLGHQLKSRETPHNIGTRIARYIHGI